MQNRQPLRTFIIYARKDEELKNDLLSHLSSLVSSGFIEPWHDALILGGEAWESVILEELAKAELVLVLVSADSLRSKFINETELPMALKQREQGKTAVVPIILRTCLWEDNPALAGMQGLPKNMKPVKSYADSDVAWTEVAAGVKNIIIEIRRKRERAGEIDNRIPESDEKLGKATSRIFDAKTSPYDTVGIVRRFLKGSIYMITKKGRQGEVKHIPVNEGHQARINNSNIGICYEMKGGTGYDLGFPISDIQEAWEGNYSTKGFIQWFEGGAIYFTERYGARILFNGNIRSKLARLEEWWKKNKNLVRTGGILGFPITNEEKVKSKFDKEGSIQRFEGGYIIDWEFGTFAVYLGFYSLYQSIDCWNSELGFPSSDDNTITSEVSGNTGSIQDFEKGCMIWNEKSNLSSIIYGEIYKEWTSQRKKYGFPLNIQYVVENYSVQDFEGGTIKWNNEPGRS